MKGGVLRMTPIQRARERARTGARGAARRAYARGRRSAGLSGG